MERYFTVSIFLFGSIWFFFFSLPFNPTSLPAYVLLLAFLCEFVCVWTDWCYGWFSKFPEISKITGIARSSHVADLPGKFPCWTWRTFFLIAASIVFWTIHSSKVHHLAAQRTNHQPGPGCNPHNKNWSCPLPHPSLRFVCKAPIVKGGWENKNKKMAWQ